MPKVLVIGLLRLHCVCTGHLHMRMILGPAHVVHQTGTQCIIMAFIEHKVTLGNR